MFTFRDQNIAASLKPVVKAKGHRKSARDIVCMRANMLSNWRKIPLPGGLDHLFILKLLDPFRTSLLRLNVVGAIRSTLTIYVEWQFNSAPDINR